MKHYLRVGALWNPRATTTTKALCLHRHCRAGAQGLSQCRVVRDPHPHHWRGLWNHVLVVVHWFCGHVVAAWWSCARVVVVQCLWVHVIVVVAWATVSVPSSQRGGTVLTLSSSWRGGSVEPLRDDNDNDAGCVPASSSLRRGRGLCAHHRCAGHYVGVAAIGQRFWARMVVVARRPCVLV